MKKKLPLTLLLSFIFGLLSSQVSQGFNYQAIARLTTGDPIINTTLPVRITIQADSLGSTIIWQELHSSVTTNGFGLINLVLGKGARQAASTVATFSAIDWTVTPKFINTEIDYSGWKPMGVTRLWSVPYAKIAENLGGAVSKLAVTGKTSVNDEALFEVKNKNGQTVFAVYNEGVRVYVSDGAKALKGGFAVGGFGTDKAESTKYLFVGKDSVRVYLDTNPLTKKLKGGFAVGGYDLTKGIVVQDYFDVNSDSVRIYIDSNPATKKLKGGFAVGGYDMTKGTNTNYMNVNTDASGIINPSQNRILWYPLKNAFLTGKVLITSQANVGENSFATGYESRAKGMYSQAMGFKAIADGDYSTAIGKYALADKINSFAFGDSARATNSEGYAIGRGAVASGYRSFAFGSAGIDSAGLKTEVSHAIGDYSFAIGQGSVSTAAGSFSIGIQDTSSGSFATSIGYKNNASKIGATAIGWRNNAIGEYSTALGLHTTASGTNSIALGVGSTALTGASTALGYYTIASGGWSILMGNQSTASGDVSTATGQFTKSIGVASFSMGYRTEASGYNSVSAGNTSIASGISSVAMGYHATASGDLSTALGGGTATGYNSTSLGRLNEASGSYSIAMGNYTIASGIASSTLGCYTTAPSGYETVIGRYNTTYTPVSTDWNIADRLFVIGSGTSSAARSNALTVLKSGRIGLQTVTNPTYALEIPNSITIGVGQARANAWVTYSDGRLKTEREPLPYGVDEIMLLKPQKYLQHNSSFENEMIQIETNGSVEIGLIAQEVVKIIPEAVVRPNDESKDLWSLAYDKLIPVLIKAMQEQQQQIKAYRSENDNLKSQLQTLQEKVDRIEAMLAKSGGN
jgi:hypothetical protein